MKSAFFLASTLWAALSPVAAAGTHADIVVTPPASLGAGILPPDRDASVNWQMAGMLATGGIPNRTAVCATVRPLGGGADDTANIQKAIEACPLGQVVSLSVGVFTVGEGHYILLDRGVTLRGAGPCAANAICTLIQRTDGCKPLSPSSSYTCGG